MGKIKKGFTVVEVALVLAIAGLIFVMVFVALPALQRSQRDNDRRDAMMAFVSRVKQYQKNNRGSLPKMSGDSVTVTWDAIKDDDTVETTSANWAGFYKGYLGEKFHDPDGDNYKLTVIKCGVGADAICNEEALNNLLYNNTFPNDYTFIVVTQSKCGERTDGTITAVGSSNPRNLSVLYQLEGAGIYCSNT